MTELPKLRPARVWRANYKSVGIEIAHHAASEFQPHGIWCGYLIFHETASPDILEHRGKADWLQMGAGAKKREIQRHHEWWDRFDWHCGITYYEERTTLHGHVEMKIGVDYAHLWDYERRAFYTESDVYADCLNIIDAYREECPEPEKPS